jgi:hypothetical protein
MTKYMIEMAHENTKQACNMAVMEVLKFGSHFMPHADWGCADDVHKAWITLEMDSKEEAMSILPPFLRQNATVTEVHHFDMDNLDDLIALHG